VTQVAVQPRGFPLAAAMTAAALLAVVTQGIAQSDRQSARIFKPLPQQRAEPVKITATALEWRERAKVATFSGDVRIVQGETDMRSNTLIVFYEDQDQSGSKQAGDRGQIRRMEAHGSVVITQKSQRAVGDRADYDVRANTITLSGNVVVTKCEEVLRGPRLLINLGTGVTRMEGGRVEAMVDSKSRHGDC
jgi:lipopolysaccharide export system protein LptA